MKPHPLFDSDWYLQQNPDVAAAGINPLQHYMQHGWREGRDPNPLFDTSYYLEQNPDVAAAGVEPLKHYWEYGWKEGRNPNALFETTFYLNKNPDVRAAGINPLYHYHRYGQKEGRQPRSVKAGKSPPTQPKKRPPTIVLPTRHNSPDRDRITTREGPHYRFVIQNDYLVDWKRLTDTSAERDPRLVSIIICVYNQPALTKECLDSLLGAEYHTPIEIVIVDNGSDAKTASVLRQYEQKYSHIRIVSNEENLNFALGNNIGFAHSRGSRVIFLNNDTTVSKNWIDGLLTLLQRPEIKGVQPKLLFPDGRVQCVGITFSNRSPIGYPIYAGEPSSQPHTSVSRGYQAITAACMAVRAIDFIALKGFDPSYINGQEDVDFCLRLGSGMPVFWCAANSVVFHHESRTEGRGRHIERNRKFFAERWRNTISSDDMRYYSEDKLTAMDYVADNYSFDQAGVACWRPRVLLPQLSTAPMTPVSGPLRTHKDSSIRIAIKCPAPSEEVAQYWGDYHFANSLAGELRKHGFTPRVDILPNWYSETASSDDVALVLRGLRRYEPRRHQANLCWLMSHPDSVSDDELESYDHVFVASTPYTQTLRLRLNVPVSELLQFSDPGIFFSPASRTDIPMEDIIFVGNSRRQMRPIIRDCIDQRIPVSVYGRDWTELIPSSMVKGEYIKNDKLHRYYGQAKIVLNDHWPDMAKLGFISNRIFDVALSGGFLISDKFAGSELFQGLAITYSDAAALPQLIKRWLADEAGRHTISTQLRQLALNSHTVAHRAVEITTVINNLTKRNRTIAQTDRLP